MSMLTHTAHTLPPHLMHALTPDMHTCPCSAYSLSVAQSPTLTYAVHTHSCRAQSPHSLCNHPHFEHTHAVHIHSHLVYSYPVTCTLTCVVHTHTMPTVPCPMPCTHSHTLYNPTPHEYFPTPYTSASHPTQFPTLGTLAPMTRYSQPPPLNSRAADTHPTPCTLTLLPVHAPPRCAHPPHTSPGCAHLLGTVHTSPTPCAHSPRRAHSLNPLLPVRTPPRRAHPTPRTPLLPAPTPPPAVPAPPGPALSLPPPAPSPAGCVRHAGSPPRCHPLPRPSPAGSCLDVSGLGLRALSNARRSAIPGRAAAAAAPRPALPGRSGRDPARSAGGQATRAVGGGEGAAIPHVLAGPAGAAAPLAR